MNNTNFSLADTAEMMCSADYKERLKAEYYQLTLRCKGLQTMLTKWNAGTLDFKLTTPQKAYTDQLSAMRSYMSALENRLIAEKLDDIIPPERIVHEASNNVTTICYGKKQIWNNRNEAEDFYLDCMANSEGAERDRYVNIYIALKKGNEICTDEELF